MHRAGIASAENVRVAKKLVRRQSFWEYSGRFVAEAQVRHLSEFRRQRLAAATGVFGLSVS